MRSFTFSSTPLVSMAISRSEWSRRTFCRSLSGIWKTTSMVYSFFLISLETFGSRV